MPVDNNTPRGNHFAAGGPRQSGSSSNPSGTNRGPAPDTTDAFMMASRSGNRTARPTAAQPIAGYSGAGVNTAPVTPTSSRGMSTHPQTAIPQTQRMIPRAAAERATRTHPTTAPKKARARSSDWLLASSFSPSWRLAAPRAFSCTRTRRIFRRRRTRSCLRSHP